MGDPHLTRGSSASAEFAPTSDRVPLVRSLILGLGLVVLGLVKYGAGSFPAAGVLVDMARTWELTGSMGTQGGYLGYSPLHVILLGSLGLTTPQGFWFGSVLLHCVAMALPVLMPVARRDPVSQGLIAAAIAGGAVLPDLTFWIGGYDSIVVIAATLAVLAGTRWLRLAAWGILAVQHSPMALAALLVWGLLTAVDEFDRTRRVPVTRLAGPAVAVLVGSVIIEVLARAWGLEQSRADFLAEYGGVSMTFSLYWPMAWLVTFGALGVVWFWILDARLRNDLVTRAFGISALLVAGVLPMVVFDEVRVPALVLLLPTLAWVLLLRERIPQPSLRGVLRTYAPIAVVLPVVLVWEGEAYFPAWTAHLG